MVTLQKFKENKFLTDQISLLEEPHVLPSALLDFEKVSVQNEETSHLSLLNWLRDSNPLGSSGKMCPESCHLMEDGTLLPSLEAWQNAGMGSPTGFLTLSMSEHNDFQELSLKEEDVCLLSDILETGEVQERYYLTQRQCQRILNRAEERDRQLPENLKNTLQEATQTKTTTGEK